MRFPTSRPFAFPISWFLLAVPLVSPLVTQAQPYLGPDRKAATKALFGRDNLIAWCIVPFDANKRSPEDRAAMLEELGFKHFAYDWRAEHIPTFDAEIVALKRHHVALDAFWAPGELNADSRRILDVLKRNGVKAQLWALLDLGQDKVNGRARERRIWNAVTKLQPLAEEAAKIGCSVALYNHGGWFGEPENQIRIIDVLKGAGVKNVGMVYNLHHGHDHLSRFPALLQKMLPYLMALNLNGSDPGGDQVGRKILPLGQGSMDLELLRTIRDSGYRGPIGILGHTQDDAEARLKDNLDGLDWLVPQLDGKAPGPKPTPRTPVPPRPAAQPVKSSATGPLEFDPAKVAAMVVESKADGDAHRGAGVFADPRTGCLSCHKIGKQGGAVGPDLTDVGKRLKPEAIVESVLWPTREVKPEYTSFVVATTDGRTVQGYKQSETAAEIVLRDPSTGALTPLPKKDVDEIKVQGTLMPDAVVAALTSEQRRDLFRFLTDLGHSPTPEMPDLLVAHGHGAATFDYDRAPLHPENWPSWQTHVNRDRLYDFYAKEADYFHKQSGAMILPEFPGLDGVKYGHWGNQNDEVWKDDRWNQSDHGTLLSGVMRMGQVTVPKGVCVLLGDRGEVSACFNPETLCYEALWRGRFIRVTPTRHGFLEGLIADGTPLPRPEGAKPDKPFVYHGFHRNGRRVVFAYKIGDTEYLDAPWVDSRGEFTRTVAPAATHPLADLTRGGPPQWPQVVTTKGKLGDGKPYAVDTIEPPFKNPWNALLFFGDHDFLPDGTALLCTMVGDVWRVEGLDGSLAEVRWRRVASGLHQALGLVVTNGTPYVLGRDQITALHDRNGDGEYDYYECFSNAYTTSPAGHDFVAGLQRDSSGNFYTASGPQGLLRIRSDGKAAEVLATGFRNPDGLGLSPEGVLTVPNSEGDWVCASMVCEVKVGGHYGYMGPKANKPPDLPFVYLPRGLDNSSGAQVTVESDRWGPLNGKMLHFSYGTGSMFLLLREQVNGYAQGAAVPIPGEFLSGAHRGRFRPRDGQLYVSGMGGWGTYTPLDGCFQRVRYTGDPVQLPSAFHAHANGVLVSFTKTVDRSVVEKASNHFAQAWNYRYSAGYGSREYSPRHPGMPGHDPLAIKSATVLNDGKSVFFEIPDLQPVNQLHVRYKVDNGAARDLFATVHAMAAPFTGIPGYTPVEKVIAAHPILTDMATATSTVRNPWRKVLPNARKVTIEAGKNLSYTVRSFKVKAGEPIEVTFSNPDVVPHNWALIKPGTLAAVGDLTNRMIADPEAVARHYVPRTGDVLFYTDMVYPSEKFAITFTSPAKVGRYPYLCTFPGHWMVMNGEMIVE